MLAMAFANPFWKRQFMPYLWFLSEKFFSGLQLRGFCTYISSTKFLQSEVLNKAENISDLVLENQTDTGQSDKVDFFL